MKKTANTFLIFIILVFLNFISFGQAKDEFAEANRLYVGKEYSQALAAYQNLLVQTLDSPTKAKIVFNIGLTYQKLKQYDQAVESFKQIFAMEANDREAGGSIMQAYQNYRPRAAWEIGNSLFAKGDYEKARAAYRMTREKYPFKSWCGTCQQSYEYDYVLYEAVCLEHLKRYDEAVAGYLKIYDPRLAEIYEANGQIEDLKTIIAKKEEPKIIEAQRIYGWTREYAAGLLPSKQLSELIKIYDLEKANNITALMNLARRYADGGGGGKQYVVVKMLARHPQQSVPLINSMLRRDGYLSALFYQVLGLAGTDEAVAILKKQAIKSINWNDSKALVESLNLSGELGKIVLKELKAERLSENMRLALRRNKEDKLTDEIDNKMKFPAVPKTKLPVDF